MCVYVPNGYGMHTTYLGSYPIHCPILCDGDVDHRLAVQNAPTLCFNRLHERREDALGDRLCVLVLG